MSEMTDRHLENIALMLNDISSTLSDILSQPEIKRKKDKESIKALRKAVGDLLLIPDTSATTLTELEAKMVIAKSQLEPAHHKRLSYCIKTLQDTQP